MLRFFSVQNFHYNHEPTEIFPNHQNQPPNFPSFKKHLLPQNPEPRKIPKHRERMKKSPGKRSSGQKQAREQKERENGLEESNCLAGGVGRARYKEHDREGQRQRARAPNQEGRGEDPERVVSLSDRPATEPVAFWHPDAVRRRRHAGVAIPCDRGIKCPPSEPKQSPRSNPPSLPKKRNMPEEQKVPSSRTR